MIKTNRVQELSLEIQEIISVFTKESFITFFTDFIRNHTLRLNEGFALKLKSKLQDSLFLIALRLSSNKEGRINLKISKEVNLILENVADKLNEMLFYYLNHNFSTDYLDNVAKKDKMYVHESTFNTYFLNGKLNYREQEIAHVRRLFSPYNKLIVERLNIDLETLISMCNYSEELYKKRTLELSFSDVEIMKKFKKISNKGNYQEIENEIEKLSNSFLDFMDNPHYSFFFSKNDFLDKFKINEIDIFCELFSISIDEELDFLLYTENNPLNERPIVKISENKYLQVYSKQLPTALYNLLYKELSKTQKESSKLNHRRGKKVLEDHTFDLFSKFLKKDPNYKMYRNSNLEGSPNEKDILILSKYSAFIIECKASKLRKPLRDSDIAFSRIKKDFKECIQKGYNQCFEVEKQCLYEDSFIIEQSKGKKINVDSSNLVNIFSIVVTLEMFGPIQTNLSFLLEKESKEDYFPWAVSVDDLEIFLKTIKITKNNPINSFIKYLDVREKLHDKILTSDEMDICASYLKNPKKFKSELNSYDFILLDPTLQNYFDDFYYSNSLKFDTNSNYYKR